MTDLIDVSLWISLASVLVSLAAAVGTVVSARVAYKALKTQTTPEVIAYVTPAADAEAFVLLVVENIGDAPAYDVSYEIKGKALESLSLANEQLGGFLGTSVPFLQPGGMRKTFLGLIPDMKEEWGDDTCWLTVEYLTEQGRKATKTRTRFPVEIFSFNGYGDIHLSSNMLNAVRDIDRNLQRVAYALERRR